jgi:PST family polysaccharide transporter
MVDKIVTKVKKATKLDMVRVFSFTSISTLVKMLAGFISVKVVAVIIGPAGIALLGQLGNFSTIIMSIATGGIKTGVTKYIAEYKDDTNSINEYIGTAVKITLFFSVLCGLFLIVGSSLLSLKILLDTKYNFVFIVFGVTLIFYTLDTLLLAIINGYKQFNLYVKVSIISSVFGLLLSLILVIPFGMNGALLNAVTSQSLVFIASVFVVKRSKIISLSLDSLWGKFNSLKAKQYFRFALMTLVSALTVPVSQLIIRDYIINQFSIQAAGWWEGLNRLSNMYLMIITSSFGVYYLPKLSEASNSDTIIKTIKTAYKVITPCLILGLIAVYFGRFVIIKLLFSSEFYEMSGLFFWKIIGDFFKISSWLIGYLMLAKAMTKLFIVTEISFSALYVGLVFIFCNLIGLQGIVLGDAVNYAVYFFVMYFTVFRRIKYNT